MLIEYLACDKDNTVKAELQDGMVAGARKRGATINVTRLDSGHTPFFEYAREGCGLDCWNCWEDFAERSRLQLRFGAIAA